MEDVKHHLQRVKKNSNDLEGELRGNSLASLHFVSFSPNRANPLVTANAEQKARLLESKVAENQGTIEQLRQERSMLAADHKALQRRYTEASEVIIPALTMYPTAY